MSREERQRVEKADRAEAKRLGYDPFHPHPLPEEHLAYCSRCHRAFRPGESVLEHLNYLGQIFWRQHPRRCPGYILRAHERPAEEAMAEIFRESEDRLKRRFW